MEFNALADLIGIRKNALNRKTLSLKSGDLPDSLSTFFTLGYDNRAVNLTNIQLVECNEDSQFIHIKGKGRLSECSRCGS